MVVIAPCFLTTSIELSHQIVGEILSHVKFVNTVNSVKTLNIVNTVYTINTVNTFNKLNSLNTINTVNTFNTGDTVNTVDTRESSASLGRFSSIFVYVSMCIYVFVPIQQQTRSTVSIGWADQLFFFPQYQREAVKRENHIGERILFSMVLNGEHWSNEGMVSYHRSGLDSMYHVSSDE